MVAQGGFPPGSAAKLRIGMVIPYVIEQTARGERVYDIYSRLLKDNIVFIGTAIDDMVANLIIAQLLWPSQCCSKITHRVSTIFEGP